MSVRKFLLSFFGILCVCSLVVADTFDENTLIDVLEGQQELGNAKAVKRFKKGSELGSSETMWGYGQCYDEGRGMENEIAEACALITVACKCVENPY